MTLIKKHSIAPSLLLFLLLFLLLNGSGWAQSLDDISDASGIHGGFVVQVGTAEPELPFIPAKKENFQIQVVDTRTDRIAELQERAWPAVRAQRLWPDPEWVRAAERPTRARDANESHNGIDSRIYWIVSTHLPLLGPPSSLILFLQALFFLPWGIRIPDPYCCPLVP